MNKSIPLSFKLLALIIYFSINISDGLAQFAWTQQADFTPGTRYGAYGFSIGAKGYVGGGVIYNGGFIYQNDFWEYDPSTNVWSQKASFAASERGSSSTFVIGQKGYACMGNNSSGFYLNDLWEYDPTSNLWIQKTSFPGVGRYGCASFVIGNNGYVGIGKNGGGYFSDCYKYNASTNLWTQVASVPGSLRVNGKGFSLGNYGYIAGGATDFINYKYLYRYDPSNNSWTQKTPYPGNGSYGFAAFTLNGLAYIGTGALSNTPLPNTFTDFYSYNPTNDTWTFFCNLPAMPRQMPVSMVINSKFYVGLGSSGVYPAIDYLADWWTTAIINQPSIDINVNVYPSPASSFIDFDNEFKEGDFIAKIFDSAAKLVARAELKNNVVTSVDIRAWAEGIYLYSISSKDEIIKNGRVTVVH